MSVPFFQHQKDIIVEDKKRFGLFLGTGSGKTRTAVALAKGPTLVICPKTQMLDGTWSNEWDRQEKDNVLIVLSFEQFKKALVDRSLYLMIMPETVIIDEAHKAAGATPYTRQKKYVKYPKTSQIFELLVKYLGEIQPKRVYPVTATPDAEPMKVWALATILGCNWDFFKFRDTFYFEKTVRGRILYMVNASKQNKELLATLVRRIGYVGRLNDWFDVPEQVWKEHVCGVSQAQQEKYEELQLLYPDPMVQVGKIHKLEQGLFEGDYVTETKLQVIEQYQKEFKKILIFAKYTDQINLYDRYFKKLGVKTYVLNGKTKNEVRKDMTKLADMEEEAVFISQSSVSAGWELPNFPCLIFASVSPSFVDFDQAIGRIQRVNNIKSNVYIFLLAGPVDKRAKMIIDRKQSFSEAKFAAEFGKEICQNKKLQ